MSGENGARPALSVCIFAWDEVETVASFVDEMLSTLRALGVTWEILLIDDGSTDGTSEKIDAKAAEDPAIRVVHHAENSGLGAVYRTGFDQARGDVVTFFPADAQFPASTVDILYPHTTTHDMVLGYLPARGDFVGKTLSAIERILYRALLGPLPRFQGIFMVKRRVLEEVPLVSRGRGWAIVMELLIRASRAGYRMKSLPTTLRPRTHGQSKVNNLRTIQANMKQLVALRRLIDRTS
ncbi:MAG: glycosyltransferase [Labilithrix sp.]|nr:glycosyltransferase [Labilithrix sp.]